MSEPEGQTRGYEPLPETSVPAEALTALDKMTADALGNPKHPFCDGSHPQHRRFVEDSLRLREVGAPAVVRPLDRMAADYEADKAAKAETAKVEARDVLAKLRAAGFEGEADAGVAKDYEVAAWKSQLMLAEGKFSELTQHLGGQLKALNQNPEIMQLFKTFTEMDIDGELRQDIAHNLIAFILKARQAQTKPHTKE